MAELKPCVSGMRVNVVYDRWPHHAEHSGYPLIARVLARHADVRRLAPSQPRFVPRRLTSSMVARAAGTPGYDSRAAARELAAAARMAAGLPEICHFLYAERDFRFAAAMSPGRRGAIVSTYHEADEHFHWTVPDQGHIASADAVVVVSEYQAHMLRDTVPAERLHVVPLGIDTAYYRPGPQATSLRAVFVGEHGRDFDLLAEVAERCRESDSSFRLDAITTPERAAELSKLADVTARSGVSDAELVRFYRGADVLLLPFLSSTANNALLEGMSCGLPVIASDVGGVREYVDADCAVLVAPGDAPRMARAVLELMHDRARNERMALASRRRALQFDWSRVAERMLAVYRAALSTRASLH
jgi:glycosyltransferase involved in cell wall biosynthesis